MPDVVAEPPAPCAVVPWFVMVPIPDTRDSTGTCTPFWVTVTAVVSPARMVMVSVTV